MRLPRFTPLILLALFLNAPLSHAIKLADESPSEPTSERSFKESIFRARLEGVRLGLEALNVNFASAPEDAPTWYWRTLTLVEIGEELGAIIQRDLLPLAVDDLSHLRLVELSGDLKEVANEFTKSYEDVDLDDLDASVAEEDFDREHKRIENVLKGMRGLIEGYRLASGASGPSLNPPTAMDAFAPSREIVADLVVVQALYRSVDLLTTFENEYAVNGEDDAHGQAELFNSLVKTLGKRLAAGAELLRNPVVKSSLQSMVDKLKSLAEEADADHLDDGVTYETDESTWTDLIERQQRKLERVAFQLGEMGAILERHLTNLEPSWDQIAKVINERPELFAEATRVREAEYRQRYTELNAELKTLRAAELELERRAATLEQRRAQHDETERTYARTFDTLNERQRVALADAKAAEARVTDAEQRLKDLAVRESALRERVQGAVTSLQDLVRQVSTLGANGLTRAQVRVVDPKLTAVKNGKFNGLSESYGTTLEQRLARLRTTGAERWKRELAARGVTQDFSLSVRVDLHGLRLARNLLARWKGFNAEGVVTVAVEAFGTQSEGTLKLPVRLRYDGVTQTYAAPKFERALDKAVTRFIEDTIQNANPKIGQEQLSEVVVRTCASVLESLRP